MDNKHINCKNCGAPLHYNGYTNRYVCEYCGSEYMVEPTPFTKYEDKVPVEKVVLIETIPPQFLTLAAEVKVPDSSAYMRDPEIVNEMVLKELTNKIAIKIPDFLTIQTAYDFPNMAQTYRAILRIVPPKKDGKFDWMDATRRIRR